MSVLGNRGGVYFEKRIPDRVRADWIGIGRLWTRVPKRTWSFSTEWRSINFQRPLVRVVCVQTHILILWARGHCQRDNVCQWFLQGYQLTSCTCQEGERRRTKDGVQGDCNVFFFWNDRPQLERRYFRVKSVLRVEGGVRWELVPSLASRFNEAFIQFKTQSDEVTHIGRIFERFTSRR